MVYLGLHRGVLNSGEWTVGSAEMDCYSFISLEH